MQVCNVGKMHEDDLNGGFGPRIVRIITSRFRPLFQVASAFVTKPGLTNVHIELG